MNTLLGICLSFIAICSFISFDYEDNEYKSMLAKKAKLNKLKNSELFGRTITSSTKNRNRRNPISISDKGLTKNAKPVNKIVSSKGNVCITKDTQSFYVKVAGTKYQDLKVAVNYARRNDLLFTRYDDMSASEIREDFYTDDDPVYETDLSDVIDEIKLIPDISNKYDANAVKVIIYINSHSFMIGYIPKNNSKEISELLKKKNAGLLTFNVTGYMTGGKYKAVDFDDHIHTGEKAYLFNLHIEAEKTDLAYTKKGHDIEAEISQRKELKIHKLRKPLSSFVSVDIETTGLNISSDEIIQIAAVKYIDNKLADTFSSFINPGKGKLPLDDFIINKTGITTQDVVNAPTFNNIKDSFAEFVENLPWIGHNIFRFDIPFLYESGLTISEFYAEDTFVMAKHKLNHAVLGSWSLPTIKNYYRINEPSHNALADSKTTALVYMHLRDDKLPRIFKNSSEKFPSLYGIHFLVIGSFPELDHDRIIDQIEFRGGILDYRWSNKTQYLVNGITSKKYKSIQNAKDHNVKFLNFNDFTTLLNHKDTEFEKKKQN